MSALTTLAVARTLHVLRRLAVPLLVVEAVGLLGLATSWRAAAITAVALILISGTVRALRRATRQVDTILREELTTSPAAATKQD